MGNTQQHESQVQGGSRSNGRRGWQSVVQWPGGGATRSSITGSSGSAGAAAALTTAAETWLNSAAAPTAATSAKVAQGPPIEPYPESPQQERQDLKRRWGDTTMYRRLEKERQVFMREALDGVVLVLPLEYADDDASSYLSAAHPPRLNRQQQQQQQQGETKYSSSNSNKSDASENTNASRLLSRFPAAALQYRAAAPEGIRWLVALEGAPDTAYAGEAFLLNFQFFPKYPIDSPELVFISPYVPLHPHVYSNGHICLSILYDHWSPALGVKACCFSLLSMLSSNEVKQPPADDRLYCEARGPRGPKGVRWIFHDDRV